MGFLDKAKQLAEQAQTKLDEVQQQFSERSGSEEQDGPAVEYDEHGRPIKREDDTAPPHGDPLADAAAQAAPAEPAAPEAPASPPPGAEQPDEDPNRPSYEPPKLSGGDPLAG